MSLFGSESGAGNTKITIFSVLGILVLTVAAGVVAFLISLDGEEQTMVPDVVGLELADALIELQEDALVPIIQKRYSSDPTLKGKIVSQKPHSGTLVKAGRRIELVVSRGAIVDRVGEYIGHDLNEVKSQLQTLFVTSKPLLTVQEPVIYVYSDQPAGTILEQKPEPGTEITDPIELAFVVSRGPEGEKIRMRTYTGLGYLEAIKRLAADNIPFRFTVRPAGAGEPSGIVVSQIPESGTEAPLGSFVELEMTDVGRAPRGYVKGVFEYSLPEYFVTMEMRLEAISPMGESRTVFSMKHPGGRIAVPYVEPENTVLVLTLQDRELIRHLVKQEESAVQPAATE
jgi:beta-lactam-binding protein with PASTA domain